MLTLPIKATQSRLLSISLLILLGLQACTTRELKLPDGTPFFTSRTNPEGMIEFAYGLAWQAPPNQDERVRGRNGRKQNFSRLTNDSSSLWKIIMEERAVEQLEDKLEYEGICDDDHEIREVVWERNRIRLMGRCL